MSQFIVSTKQLLSAIEIRPFTTEAEFHSLADIWYRLEMPLSEYTLGNRYDSIMSGWQAFASLENTQLGTNRHRVALLVLSNGKPISIMPFVKLTRKRSLGPLTIDVDYVESIGSQWGLDQFKEPIGVNTVEIMQVCLDWIYKNERFDILNLLHMSPGGTTAQLDPKRMHLHELYPIIDLHQSSYEAHVRSYGKQLRQNLRTARNRARRNGIKLSFQRTTINANTLPEIIRLAHCRSASNKETQFAQYQFQQFIANLPDAFVMFMQANGQNIAYRISIMIDGIEHCIDNSFDRAYKQYYCGTVLIDETIRQGYQQRLDWLSPGMGAYANSLQFATKCIGAYKYTRAGNTVRASAIEALITSRNQMKAEFMQRRLNLLAPHCEHLLIAGSPLHSSYKLASFSR